MPPRRPAQALRSTGSTLYTPRAQAKYTYAHPVPWHGDEGYLTHAHGRRRSHAVRKPQATSPRGFLKHLTQKEGPQGTSRKGQKTGYLTRGPKAAVLLAQASLNQAPQKCRRAWIGFGGGGGRRQDPSPLRMGVSCQAAVPSAR